MRVVFIMQVLNEDQYSYTWMCSVCLDGDLLGGMKENKSGCVLNNFLYQWPCS